MIFIEKMVIVLMLPYLYKCVCMSALETYLLFLTAH